MRARNSPRTSGRKDSQKRRKLIDRQRRCDVECDDSIAKGVSSSDRVFSDSRVVAVASELFLPQSTATRSVAWRSRWAPRRDVQSTCSSVHQPTDRKPVRPHIATSVVESGSTQTRLFGRCGIQGRGLRFHRQVNLGSVQCGMLICFRRKFRERYKHGPMCRGTETETETRNHRGDADEARRSEHERFLIGASTGSFQGA